MFLQPAVNAIKDGSAADVMRSALIKVRSPVKSTLSGQKAMVIEPEKSDEAFKRSRKNSQDNLLEVGPV